MGKKTNLKTLWTILISGNNFKTSLVLIAAFTVFSGVASTYAECDDVVTEVCESRISFTLGGGTYKIPYCRNHAIGEPNDNYVRAIIVIHGCSRTAPSTYDTMEDIAIDEDKDGNTLIIAPQFLREDSDVNDISRNALGNDILYWSNDAGFGYWAEGYNSANAGLSEQISSFTVIDEIIERLALNFSNLKQIIVVGHSAGGQFTTRYAAGTKVPEETLYPAGIDIRFIVANPSSYLYLTNKRWDGVNTNPYVWIIPADDCVSSGHHYDNYRYGLRNITYTSCDYMRQVDPTDPGGVICDQFQQREVIYLLGDQDTVRDSSLDDSCAADTQGLNRYERGTVYYRYLQDHFTSIGQQQRKHIAPGVGHDSSGMYNSYYGKEFLFYGMSKPMNILADDGTSTTGVQITWDSVADATSYHVRRATAADGTWADIGSWQSGTTYTDTTGTQGQVYYYSVVAKNDDRYSARGPYDTGWRKLSAPTGVSASDGTYTDKVQITWGSVTGATHYQVYRATSAGGTKTAISTWQSSTTYDDTSATPGATYYYWVRAAVSDAGANPSDYSSSDTGWQKLLAPTNVTASDGAYTDNVQITWSSVTGASYYHVYRSTSVGGTKDAIGSWQTGTTYSDAASTPGVRYYYWVTAAISNSGEHESGYSSYDTGWRKLSPPSGVTATDGTYTDKVQITWNTANGASYYRVYRSTSAGGTKTAISGWQSSTSYDDTTATPGETYYYWVTSATSSGGADESDFSSSDIGWRKLMPPVGVLASDGLYTDKVSITWSSVTGATHYLVSRAESAGGTKTDLGTWQSSTLYDDTSAQTEVTYYYWVRAAADSGGLHASDYSSYDTGWRDIPLPSPTGVSATDGTDTAKVQITWNTVDGATHYRVYSATSAGGTKTAISSWQAGTIYNDTSATPGVTYYYWVKAAASSSGDKASDYSSYDTGWRQLSPPTNINASDGTYMGRIEISWAVADGASHYRLYYGTAQFGDKTPLSSWQTETSFSHTNPVPGETYWYWVKAATSSSGDRASDYSIVNDGWCPLSPPAWVSATDGAYADKVQVTWAAVTGASNYQVYRATSPGGTKTAISDWWVITTSYDDTTATPGVNYYYWVKAACNMSGWRATDYSPYDAGWCLLSVGFSSAASNGLETTSSAKINVVLSHSTTGQITVDYAVTGGTATNGTDYNLTAGTLTFAAGQTTKTIDISVIYDGLTESDETIEITLSNPGGLNVALGAIPQHVYTILDNTRYSVCPDGSGDFTTIQPAVDTASDRDVIELCDATYTGTGNKNIDYLGKAITIRSQSGNPENCVINCQGSGRGFKFVNDEDANSILEGITITNGVGSSPGGGAILCGITIIFPIADSHYGSPTINNCIISNNTMAGGLSGGYGGGIYCHESSCPTINDCLFTGNTATGISSIGGGMYCKSGTSTLTGCTFIDNDVTSSGGAFVADGSFVTFYNCIFADNSANLGGAVLCSGIGGVFEYCTFYDNTASIDGGAIYCANTSVYHLEMSNCTLNANSAPYGSGIFLHTNSLSSEIDNTIISNGLQGEAVECYSSSATLTCCDVNGNAGGDWVGCIAGQDTIRPNLSLDPLFCDPNNGNFRLQPTSPCAPFSPSNPDCGLIGAWPVGYKADINIDGRVDLRDFAAFASYWLQSGCGECGGADLVDDDEYVGLDDLCQFAADWLAGTDG